MANKKKPRGIDSATTRTKPRVQLLNKEQNKNKKTKQKTKTRHEITIRPKRQLLRPI